MRKHEMVLDFTSLLDVILIILFLVLCTMNGKAQKDADKIDSLTEANSAYAQQVKDQGDEIDSLTQTNKEQADKIAELEQLVGELTDKNAELAESNEYYKNQAENAMATLDKYMEISGLGSTDKTLYALFKEKSISLELNLLKKKDPKTGAISCEIKLYMGNKVVGQPLTIDPDAKKKETNTVAVRNWLAPLLKKYVSDASYKVAVIVISYDGSATDNGVSNSAFTPVNDAVQKIETDKTKNYELWHTIDSTNYVKK